MSGGWVLLICLPHEPPWQPAWTHCEGKKARLHATVDEITTSRLMGMKYEIRWFDTAPGSYDWIK